MSDEAPQPSFARVKELLVYDPGGGSFVWRAGKGHTRQGRPAGCVHTKKNGRKYLRIQIDGRLYLAQRLAFLYMTGVMPNLEVDHKDNDSLNNSWDNLRLATASQNRVNAGLRANNTTGFKGVIFDPKTGRYRAQMYYQGKKNNLGHYDTPEQAADAYDAAFKAHYGDFALTNAQIRSA